MLRNTRTHHDTTIHDITHNSQATHNQLVVNSVAMVIQRLFDAEIGPIPSNASEAVLNKRDLDWEIKSILYIIPLIELRTEDFFKQGEMDLPANQALREEIDQQWATVRDYVIARKRDPIVPSFDVVTLFYPKPDGEDGFIEETVELPLKIVLPLLINAYFDDAKFAHSYSGSPDEQLEQAKQDRPNRLLTLFRCFQRVHKGLCPTGIRNELVLLLNKVYEGIDLIEDLKATMQYFLSEQLNKRFWLAYEQATRTANQTVLNRLKIGYLQWMTDGNPVDLLLLIDPEHDIKTELDDLIIAHGTDPHRLSVKCGEQRHISYNDYFTRLTRELAFSMAEQHNRILSQIELILNENSDGDTPKHAALYHVQRWLREYFVFNLNPEQTSVHEQCVFDFAEVYQTHQDILSYQFLLIVTEIFKQEDIHAFIASCHVYYYDLARSTETIVLGPSDELLTRSRQVQASILRAKKESLCDKIENYFSLIFQNDNSTKALLYNMLLDHKTAAQITLNDIELSHFSSRNIEEEDGITYRTMTPYEINRIFLHAIINQPNSWSPLFAKTFQLTLDLVTRLDESHFIHSSLSQSSYPPMFMAQLNYLQNMYIYLKSEITPEIKPTRPFYAILLPQDVQTANDWIRIAADLGEQSDHYYFRDIRLFRRLPNLLMEYIQDSTWQLIQVICAIPQTQWMLFLNQFGLERINRLMSNNGCNERGLQIFFSNILSEVDENLVRYGAMIFMRCVLNNPEQIHPELVSVLIALLLRSNDRLTIQYIACVLSVISAFDVVNHLVLQAGGIVPLIALLASEDRETKEYAAAALSQFAVQNVANQNAIREAGGIAALIALFCSESSNEAKEFAISILMFVVRGDAADINMICENVNIPTVIALLTSNHRVIERYASNLLCELASNFHANYRDLVREAGGIAPLVALLCSNDIESKHYAAITLGFLAYNNVANQNAIYDAGGIASLLVLLAEENKDTQKCAISALTRLAMGHAVNKNVIYELGGIALLVGLWRLKKRTMKEYISLALKVLADDNVRNKDAIIHQMRAAGLERECPVSIEIISKVEFARILNSYPGEQQTRGCLSSFSIFSRSFRRSRTMMGLESLLQSSSDPEVTRAQIEEAISRGEHQARRLRLFQRGTRGVQERGHHRDAVDEVITMLRDSM